MNNMTPYLRFNGNCREAFQFYADSLGGTLDVETIGTSAVNTQFPATMHNRVMHATLSNEQGIIIMGSDMLGDSGWIQGTNIALSYTCSESDIENLFHKLSVDGSVLDGVKRQFWGDLFCMFMDKFGIQWMLNAPAQNAMPEREELHFSILIDAPKQKVWDVLLNDETYRKWTSAFHPGSFAEGNWTEGSKVHFKTPEGDGMVSRVAVHRPAEIISFEHLGVLANNEEIFDHPEAKKWQGSRETYKVTEDGHGTLLTVDQDITPDYKSHMESAWLLALQMVKDLAEKAAVAV